MILSSGEKQFFSFKMAAFPLRGNKKAAPKGEGAAKVLLPDRHNDRDPDSFPPVGHARFRVPAADKVIAPRPKNAPRSRDIDFEHYNGFPI